MIAPILVILFFSIIFHEYAHGYVAMRCGDNTAKYAGRLTFNPIPHVDLFGTVILPLLLYFTQSSFLFGWAKPVPVNPYNFRNPEIDNLKVSLAGPVSNLLLAVGFTILSILLGMFFKEYFYILIPYLKYGLKMNVLLAIFNLIPIPPLDGSHVLSYFLPPDLALKYQQIQQYGMMLLVIFIMTPLFDIVYFFTDGISNILLIIIQFFI